MSSDRTPDHIPTAAPILLSEAPPASNPLLAVARRWPLLIVGLGIGLVAGAILHVSSPPQYQSSAQVMVVKKRTDVVQGGDVRLGVVEDYVATQVTLIKSEKIRRSTVKELRSVPLTQPLPADDGAAADSLRAGLTVAREKDTSGGSQIGSGVLNLSYRGGDPQDTRRILDALIKVHRQELYAIFSEASRERGATLTSTIKLYQSNRKLAEEARQKGQQELREITTENVPSIAARITVHKDKLSSLDLELIDLKEQLELIAKAGTNRNGRLAVLNQLTSQTRTGALVEVNPAEVGLRQAEAQLKELSTELGKDHPRMKALASQIEFYRDEIQRQNPDKSAQLDELDALGQRLKQRQRTAELQQKQLDARLFKDEDTVKRAGAAQDAVEGANGTLKLIDAEIARLNVELSTVQATQESTGYSADPITPPNVGGKVAPVLPQSLALGLALGILLGGGAVIFAELTDKSFKSPAEIQRRLGVPVIGHVPQIRLNLAPEPGTPVGLEPVLVAALRPKSAEAEAYRGVRTAITFMTQGRGPQVIQVTSPNPGDGKSTLAANLAISLAQSGKRVALIDADFRKPRIHRLFNLTSLSANGGLAGVVAGQALLAAAVRPQILPNLDILPCGERPKNPAELLTSPQFHDVLTELKARYDFVIVDTPPILAVSDPAVIASQVDGVVMVFRMTKNARPVAERTREQLGALGANLLGVVVNGSSSGRGYADYNYGGSGYRYSDYHYTESDSVHEGVPTQP